MSLDTAEARQRGRDDSVTQEFYLFCTLLKRSSSANCKQYNKPYSKNKQRARQIPIERAYQENHTNATPQQQQQHPQEEPKEHSQHRHDLPRHIHLKLLQHRLHLQRGNLAAPSRANSYWKKAIPTTLNNHILSNSISTPHLDVASSSNRRPRSRSRRRRSSGRRSKSKSRRGRDRGRDE